MIPVSYSAYGVGWLKGHSVRQMSDPNGALVF